MRFAEPQTISPPPCSPSTGLLLPPQARKAPPLQSPRYGHSPFYCLNRQTLRSRAQRLCLCFLSTKTASRLTRLRMAETLQAATKLIEQGHVRVGTEPITDTAFLVERHGGFRDLG